MDAASRQTIVEVTYGEVVWFWRSDAGAKVVKTLPASHGRRWQPSMVTGKSTKDTVKTIAQGRPDDLAEPVVTPPAFCLQAGHGCGQHPAFPAPSSFSRAMLATARARNAPRECGRALLLPR